MDVPFSQLGHGEDGQKEKSLSTSTALPSSDPPPSPSSGSSARFKLFVRAVIGECFATFMFIFLICTAAIQPSSSLLQCVASCFAAVGVIFTFSPISGAHLNPAVTFAVYITKRTSNRKMVGYLIAQFVGAQMAMVSIYFAFDSVTAVQSLSVVPMGGTSLWSVFYSEFVTTFILVFVIFAVAIEDVDEEKKSTMSFKAISHSKGLTIYSATPQSRLGFAPLIIGMTLAALSVARGTSGTVFNPIRMISPIVWGGDSSYVYIYLIGEFGGAAAAALVRSLFVSFARAEIEADKRGKGAVNHLEHLDLSFSPQREKAHWERDAS